MKDWQTGEWVTFQTSDGYKVRGQVVNRTEKQGEIEYTLKQFPDAPTYTDVTA